MNNVEAKSLGLDELKRRKEAMSQDIDRDPNVWTVIINAISELEWEQQQTQQHEERVKESIETVQTSLGEEEIEGFAIRDLCLDEMRYQLLSIWVQRKVEAQAEHFSRQIQQEVAEGKRLRDEFADAQDVIEAKDAEISTLRSQNYQLSIENQQLNDYRDNAGNIIVEKDAEIARLNSQVEELRIEAAVGARNAYKVITNLDGAKELADKIRASLIPVTSIDKVNSNTIVVTHPDGRQEQDNWLNKGKYRVVGGEEAARFHEEQAKLSTNVQEVAATEPVTFQIEPPQVDLHGIHEDPAQGDSGEAREDAETLGDVSREEFEALKARVTALEVKQAVWS